MMNNCFKCDKKNKGEKAHDDDIFVLNSRKSICNDCWLKLSEKEMAELRIKDWRLKNGSK